ncbi:MAG TPA: YetF domain-containing protein [Patescibacteria group bacterium]|nr:YetF domain-containing protein [Patescibacteria group bacterium]
MILDIILRSLAVYIFIVFAIRLFGKREIAQLSITDLVFILLISNSVQNAMVGSDSSLLGGVVAAGTLFIVNFGVGYIFFKSKKLTTFLEGHPIMLIYNGHVIKEHLAKSQISDEELEAVVREHGVEKVEDVNLAILELDGNISVLSDDFKRRTVKKRHAHRVVSKTT